MKRDVVSRAFLDSSRFAGLGARRTQALSPLPFPPPPPSPETFIPPPPVSPQNAALLPSSTTLLCRQEIPLGATRRTIIELPEDVKPEEIQRVMRILQALADPIQ